MNAERFTGGRQAMWALAAAGAVGLLATAALGLLEPRRALFSYLVAFVFWLGVPLGALFLLAVFHASSARWMVVLRRLLEVLAASVAVFLPLFLPVALGLSRLYLWAAPPDGLGEHELSLLAHKRPYLNAPFFLGRAAFYFAVWLGVGLWLHRLSARQDEGGEGALTVRQRRLGAGALPLLAVTLTFAAFDWLMSLHPFWFSTVFGVYVFAGAFVAALAALILAALAARARAGLAVGEDHLHSLGKLLFAFVAFWAYIAFAQYMLIWISNLPQEVPWYLLRTRGEARWLALALGLTHFVVPFAVLLSRRAKVSPRVLVPLGGWILAAHYLDVYWLVMPAFGPTLAPALTDLAALVGVGGVAAAFALFLLRGERLFPAKDPFLADSLGYRP